jgi:hypothetical protein
MDDVGGEPSEQQIQQRFSVMGWVKNTDGMRHDLNLERVAPWTGLALALGVGGLVGTGFITKKMVRVCKEAIALKKQIQANPKDCSLRKKRRTLIGKAIGMGIGGLVLFLLFGVGLLLGTLCAKFIRNKYVADKAGWARQRYSERCFNLRREFSPRGHVCFWMPLSSAQLENYELLMAHKPLPLRNPRSGDTLDYPSYDAVRGHMFPYTYNSETKKWVSIAREELKNLEEYGGKTWASFGFTEPEAW